MNCRLTDVSFAQTDTGTLKNYQTTNYPDDYYFLCQQKDTYFLRHPLLNFVLNCCKTFKKYLKSVFVTLQLWIKLIIKVLQAFRLSKPQLRTTPVTHEPPPPPPPQKKKKKKKKRIKKKKTFYGGNSCRWLSLVLSKHNQWPLFIDAYFNFYQGPYRFQLASDMLCDSIVLLNRTCATSYDFHHNFVYFVLIYPILIVNNGYQ